MPCVLDDRLIPTAAAVSSTVPLTSSWPREPCAQKRTNGPKKPLRVIRVRSRCPGSLPENSAQWQSGPQVAEHVFVSGPGTGQQLTDGRDL